MFWTFHIDGRVYGSPEMVRTLWWVEILFALLAAGVVFAWANWKAIGFGRLSKLHLLWLVVPTIALTMCWVDLIPSLQNFSKEMWKLFGLMTFTTFLVGFSEEIVFRGFVLRSFLTRYPTWLSMFLSALAFSIFHLVNLLAGFSMTGVLVQLVVTFLTGLFYAPLALKLRSLCPLIVLHWQWNLVVMTGELSAIDLPSLDIFLVAQLAAIVPLWFITLRDKPRRRSELPIEQ